MGAKSLESRLEYAFRGNPPGGRDLTPKDYLDVVRTNWRSAENSLRRTTLGLLVVAVLFELVSQGGVAEFALGPVKVTDLTLVQKAVPVGFAYLTLEWVALGILINRLGSVHDAVVRLEYPRLYEEDLELAMAPTVMSLAGEARIVGEPGRTHTLMQMLTQFKTLALLILLLAAQVVFHVRQFRTFGFSDVLVWSAFIVTIVFMAQTIIIVPKLRGDPRWSM